jgi:hypothetical protein
MKTRTLKAATMFLQLIVIAASSIPAMAQTAPPRTTLTNMRFNGLEARALSEVQSPDGCVATVLDVFANLGPGTDNTSGRPTGPVAIVYTGSIDLCAGGQIPFNGEGFVDLSPGQFTVDESLGSAALKVTVPVHDRVSGNTVNFDVDLKWTATSEPQVIRAVFHEILPDGTEQFAHSNGTFREALASGTVSNGSVNLTPDPATGDLQSVREGDLTLTRPAR